MTKKKNTRILAIFGDIELRAINTTTLNEESSSRNPLLNLKSSYAEREFYTKPFNDIKIIFRLKRPTWFLKRLSRGCGKTFFLFLSFFSFFFVQIINLDSINRRPPFIVFRINLEFFRNFLRNEGELYVAVAFSNPPTSTFFSRAQNAREKKEDSCRTKLTWNANKREAT